MNPQTRLRPMVFGGALVLGLLADQLIFSAPGRPAFSMTLWAIAGTIVLALAARERQMPVSRESMLLVGGALAITLLMILRDAEALYAFGMFAGVAMLGLAAGRAALPWASRAYISDIAVAAARVGVLIALGPLGWSLGGARETAPTTPVIKNASSRRHARTFARGTVMALPPLLILTALLTSADPVFARVLEDALSDSLKPLLQHILVAGIVAWLVSGYARAFLVRDELVTDRVDLPRLALAPSEIAVSLTLLNVLFIAFLVVQVRYLFGGSALVEVTPGLSYADYARRGFFEMVAAAAFVVPVLLIAHWAAAQDDSRARRLLTATSLVLVVLLGGVLASAAYRMRLYQDAYGLTEDRLYGTMFTVWIAAVIAWLALTVLRGRRQRFAFGAVMAGVACIVGLNLLNPHALIARVNIARATSGAEYDGKYLQTLSADAVPTLIERLPALPIVERCRVTTMLEKRWSGERLGGWRTWNLSDARARTMVKELEQPAECRGLAVR